LAFVGLVSCFLTYILIKASSRIGIIDVPNHRSLHDRPKPRTGGLAILVAITLGLASFNSDISHELFSFFPYILLLAGMAILDDIYSISALSRLFLQVIVASLVIYNGLSINTFVFFHYEMSINPIIGVFLTILFIVWLVNLYNFMDGMDGFSAGMAIFGFGTFAILAFLKGEDGFAFANLVIVVAVFGFLIFNLPPSKIFMGDVGSTVIGMFVALFALWADNQGIFPVYLSVIIFTPFILDSTVTLIKRALRREKLMEAHRSHYYQRLVLSGWGHKKTLVVEYIWMSLCSLVSIILFKVDNRNVQISVLVIFVLACLIFLIRIDKTTKKIQT